MFSIGNITWTFGLQICGIDMQITPCEIWIVSSMDIVSLIEWCDKLFYCSVWTLTVWRMYLVLTLTLVWLMISLRLCVLQSSTNWWRIPVLQQSLAVTVSLHRLLHVSRPDYTYLIIYRTISITWSNIDSTVFHLADESCPELGISHVIFEF